MRADCASGSDSYARRINCKMSEFSSPQMRCIKIAAKYRTIELVIIRVMPFASAPRLLPRRCSVGYELPMAWVPHSSCSELDATPAGTEVEAVLT